MKPHKHAELIKAWADGATIQIHMAIGWTDCNPTWMEGIEYRIKPEPDVIRYTTAFDYEILPSDGTYESGDNLKLTFDGETGKLKSAEVIK